MKLTGPHDLYANIWTLLISEFSGVSIGQNAPGRAGCCEYVSPMIIQVGSLITYDQGGWRCLPTLKVLGVVCPVMPVIGSLGGPR